MTSTNVSWITRDIKGELLRFFDVDLSSIRTDGVYVIYQPGSALTPPRTIYVGQGVVADRLGQHRTNQTMKALDTRTPRLYVAFAAVSVMNRDGVEAWLADRLQPMLGDAHPTAMPVAVNLPFAA